MTDLCLECGQEQKHYSWCSNYVTVLQTWAAEPKARARQTDPATSHVAAASVQNLTETQTLILQLLGENGPLTDIELFTAWPKDWPTVSMSGLRTRRSELHEAGKVVDTDHRRLSPSGRPCVVWGLA
jgi:hypothetical protein